MKLLLVLLVAAAVRVAALVPGDAVSVPYGDEIYYLRQAHSIAEGLGHPGSFRPPLYPAFIAAVFSVAGADPTAVRWAQIGLSLAAVALVWALARARYGDRAALFSGLACALSPGLVHFSHFLWAETLFVTLFLVFLCSIDRFARAPGRGSCALAGLALSLAALAKEIAVPFALVILPWFLARPDGTRRQKVQYALLFLTCFALPLLPWSVRNLRVHGTWVGISTCRWFPIAVGNLRAEDESEDSEERTAFLAEWRSMQNEVEKERFSRDTALRTIREQQPLWLLRKLALNLPRLVSPKGQEIRHLELGLYPRETGLIVARAHVVASLVGHLLLVAPGLLGLWLAREDPLKGIVLAMIGCSLAIYTVANATPRFFVPLLPLFHYYLGPLAAGRFEGASRSRWIGGILTAALFIAIVLAQVPGELGPAWDALAQP
jgi:4-amino-4-deoxy-L-arabinose transferase-like glycosyltransferase